MQKSNKANLHNKVEKWGSNDLKIRGALFFEYILPFDSIWRPFSLIYLLSSHKIGKVHVLEIKGRTEMCPKGLLH